MSNKETEAKKQIIDLVIEKEKDLYNPFDLEKNLSEDVKTHIMKKAREKRLTDVQIRIVYQEAVNEEDVRAAIFRWLDSAKEELKGKTRKNLVKMIWLFVFGIVVISLSIFLQSKINSLLFTIITTVGTFSIWEGANAWIIQGPDLRIQKRILNRIIDSTEIEFVPADQLRNNQS